MTHCNVRYHGTIDRVEAEKRLRAAGHRSGVYLVRAKEEGNDGEYVLSLLTSKKVIHYVIKAPAVSKEHITVQGKPLASRLVRGIRSAMQYLQKFPEEIIAKPLEYPAPIPHQAIEWIKKVAAELGLDTSAIIEADDQIYAMSSASAVGGDYTVADRLYMMLTEEFDTYAISGYTGHPSGVYYRVFLALEEIQPHFTLYTRVTADGGAPRAKVSATDVFDVLVYKRKGWSVDANTPLYARVSPTDLAGYLAGNGLLNSAGEVYDVVDDGDDYEAPQEGSGFEEGDRYEVAQIPYQPGNDEASQITYASYGGSTPGGGAYTNGTLDRSSVGSAFVPEGFGTPEDESNILYAVYAGAPSPYLSVAAVASADDRSRGGVSSSGGGGGGSGYMGARGGGYIHVSGVDPPLYGNNTLERKKRSKEEEDIYKNNTLERKKVSTGSTATTGGKGRHAAKSTPTLPGVAAKGGGSTSPPEDHRRRKTTGGSSSGNGGRKKSGGNRARAASSGSGAMYGNVAAGVEEVSYGNVPATSNDGKAKKGGGGGIKRNARGGSVYLGFNEVFGEKEDSAA